MRCNKKWRHKRIQIGSKSDDYSASNNGENDQWYEKQNGKKDNDGDNVREKDNNNNDINQRLSWQCSQKTTAFCRCTSFNPNGMTLTYSFGSIDHTILHNDFLCLIFHIIPKKKRNNRTWESWSTIILFQTNCLGWSSSCSLKHSTPRQQDAVSC